MKSKILLFGLILATSLSVSAKSFSIKYPDSFDSSFFKTGFDSDLLLIMAQHSKSNNADSVMIDLNN